MFAAGIGRRVDYLTVDPTLRGLRLGAGELHGPRPSTCEYRAVTAKVEASDVGRLFIRDRRQSDEVACRVLAGEAPELGRVLARLQHDMAVAVVDSRRVAADEHALRGRSAQRLVNDDPTQFIVLTR